MSVPMTLLDDAGLKPRHLNLLAILIEHERLSASSAAALLGLTRATTSRLVRTLVERGFASRTDDAADFRVVLYAATQSGRALAAGTLLRAYSQQKDTTP